MTHAIYQTKAFILKTKNTRESSKMIILYTERFGLLYATLQSIREMKSKMKYHIHDYSLVNIDILRGKNIWKIVGVSELNPSFIFVNTSWYRIISLLSDNLVRLCPGEEKNETLWNEIITFLYSINDLIKQKKNSFLFEYETIIMVRILHALGYWEDDDFLFKNYLPYSKDVLDYVHRNRVNYIKKINDSLYQSQL